MLSFCPIKKIHSEEQLQVDRDDVRKITAFLIYLKNPKLYEILSILKNYQELFNTGQSMVKHLFWITKYKVEEKEISK